jgi:hypothetical protein
MKKYFLTLFSILIIAESCSTTSKLYRYNDKNKTYTGQLNDSTFSALKQYLTSTINSKLKDTIIIKYDYNNETCWNILDEREKDHIMGFVTRHKERVQQVLATRQNVSVFDFREPGNNLNKIKMWDNSIIIDTTKQLMNLLFKERCTCGSSIIVMPDKKFVFLRSDSHSDVLDLPQKQIIEILNKK